MRARGWIALAAITGVVSMTALVVLALAGLGDFNGDSAREPVNDLTETTPTAATGDIVVIARDIKFLQTSLETTPGEHTITFQNQDNIVHNLHLFRGDDATGESVAATDKDAGPVTNTLPVTLEPGKYYYRCDIHPEFMHGVLTVAP